MIKGRVGALIAVGAGFHPHMTGRENTYLNGTILGMSRAEIDAKFQEIVDFSEVGDFIDSPVSTYSSGMRVRLGFSIATAIEPDVLIVDEVLAVGDAGFRTKALNRMRELMATSAVIFVSHSMPQVTTISSKIMLLRSGAGKMYGDPEKAVEDYLGMFEHNQKMDEWFEGSNSLGNIEIRQINNLKGSSEGAADVTIEYEKPFCISMEASIETKYTDLEFHVQFVDSGLNTVLISNSVLGRFVIKNPNSSFRINFDCQKMLLNPEKFYLSVTVIDAISKKNLARKWHCTSFHVTGGIYGARYPRVAGEWSLSLV